jgi:hypothetical protein
MSPRDSFLDANVYTNFFFRFRYPFSASWVPEMATDKLQQVSPSCLGNPTDSGANSPSKNLYNLLTLERNFPRHGTVGDSKGTIWLIAENLSGEQSISSEKNCLEKLSARAQADHLTPTRDIQEVKPGGLSFFRQDFAGVSYSGGPLHETALFTLSKGYALGFVFIGPNEQSMTNMIATLEKLDAF